jgi:OOP family OmpA-OmpF porin
MKNRYLLGAGVALAMAFGGVQAHAQMFGPFSGAFYLGPEGGWTHLQSQSPTVTAIGPTGRAVVATRSTSFDAGFNVGVRGGYQWGPWRFEEEYSYRNNNPSNNPIFTGTASGLSFAGRSTSGSVRSNAIMTNVIYDFTLGWPITPHIGAGIGAVNINGSFSGTGTVTLANGTTGSFTTNSVSGNTWQFGYQGIAGLRYDINPSLAFDIDYRYLATPDFTINAARNTPAACCLFTSVKSRYQTQNVVASLTMKFGAPPAPPPPAPPAPPPPPAHQVYLVFFDWDKYNITSEGMQILQAAAAQYKAGGSVRLQVTGYTDLTGSAGYNQRLSERRANAVANALASMGVARGDMVVTGRGMNDPRVPTPLGVREPQNRRVEIVFP